MGIGAYRRRFRMRGPESVREGIRRRGDWEERRVVWRGRRAGLPVGSGKCAYVHKSGGIAVAGKQCGAWAIFPGAEAWAGGAGVAELECQVAWAGCGLPLAATDGGFGEEDEPAVPRPAGGDGGEARGVDVG